MKTILSFQDESHRVQLVVCAPVGFLEKHVILDNRKVVQTFFADEPGARRRFYLYVGNIILQTGILFSN